MYPFETHVLLHTQNRLRPLSSLSPSHLIIIVRLDSAGQAGVNITGGPLQYQHRAEALFLHWGRGPGHTGGSEHSVSHMTWAGEIQIYGYNTQLYSNLSQVQREKS